MKLVFVILNYNTFEETKECISSIFEHIDINEYKIVVVDNGSSDNSLIKLENEYLKNNKVDIIPIKKNLGFAKGNNVGIKYANESYNPDFVVVLNSDTEIFQNDFYAKISSRYERSNFGVLGPMMLTGNGRCDNSPWKPGTLEQMKAQLNKLERDYKLFTMLPYFLWRIKNKITRILTDSEDPLHSYGDFWKYQEDVELQGAFLVFSKDIFRYIEGFDPRTFLYFEEQLLYLAVKRVGMKIVYDPQIVVYHKEGISTKKIKKSKQKEKFILRCNIESLNAVISEMENNIL